MGEEKSFSQRAFSIYTDIRKLQDKAKTSYTLSTRRLRFGYEQQFSRVEWCACFVSWCADQCGYIESGLVPKFAGCVDGANWFKSNGKWQDRTYEPKVGDIIFFDWEGDGTTDHVGIVEKCENGTVYTVEGNSGDACNKNV